ncbi:hypothetical protein MSAN_01827800 [Mycena sanguinolenta]|uniref:Uncharacterized protein n=1 Tax=Mycena sanguinolenta TaxID=230812 RepID=A0A8H6XSN4_9AGAR|nr:hypothetical protein MSAN_01827800 [Mycena sanguinolenta]
MASRRSTPEVTHLMPDASARDAPPKWLACTDHESSLRVPPVPCRSGSLVTRIKGADRRSNPSSDEVLSAPSTVPNARKRHRNRRCNHPSEPHTQNTSFPDRIHRKHAQTNGDSETPAKRVRKAVALPIGGPGVRNQSTPNTRFKRRKTSTSAATGEQDIHDYFIFLSSGKGFGDSAHPGAHDPQLKVNANERMELPYVAVTGGFGGAGGPGDRRSGNGGNGMGPVFNVNSINFYIQR